jgi:bifunctional non-homologous end joining protein LigD
MGKIITLSRYRTKRNFRKTPEPLPKRTKKVTQKHIFVVQKHQASHLHYDFRLEIGGVLKSWAVPKGPSLNPREKRLAIEVEDHPFEYRDFEGIIPPGNYGAGTVMVWDEGEYYPVSSLKNEEAALKKGYKEGKLEFILNGTKLKGIFSLVRIQLPSRKNSWLLVKKKDEFSTNKDVALLDRSVQTGRTLEEIAKKKKSRKTAIYKSYNQVLRKIGKNKKAA